MLFVQESRHFYAGGMIAGLLCLAGGGYVSLLLWVLHCFKMSVPVLKMWIQSLFVLEEWLLGSVPFYGGQGYCPLT